MAKDNYTRQPIDDLATLAVAGAARLIATGALSVRTFNEAFIEQVASWEPYLKAFSYLDYDAWASQATKLDKEAQRGRIRGPLHGIPVAIKDQFFVRNMPCRVAESWGLVKDSVSEATLVRKLRDAGAIVVGTTQMVTRNEDAPTRNPWDLARSPGGSSSGSAAAVAARMVPLTLGESTGGSGIRPPAYCGVDALKPTFGRLATEGLYPFTWSFDSPTIIASTMEDVAYAFDALAPRLYDRATSEGHAANVVAAVPARIGLVRNYFLEKADGCMIDAIENAAGVATEIGAHVIDIDLPSEFRAVWSCWNVIADAEFATLHAQHGSTTAPLGMEGASIGALIPASYYVHAQRVRGWLEERLKALIAEARVNFLLTPAARGVAPFGRDVGESVMNIPWTTLGWPTLTWNIGVSPQEGLPLGAQLTAQRGCEDDLLTLATRWETRLGRHTISHRPDAIKTSRTSWST